MMTDSVDEDEDMVIRVAIQSAEESAEEEGGGGGSSG